MAVHYPQCWALLSVVFEFGDGKPQTFLVPARQATVHHNDYRTADSWSLEFAARLLELDPDMVRSLAAQIYMFDAGKVTADIESFLVEDNLLISGLAIDIDMAAREGVALTGEDYTGLLTSKEWPQGKLVPVGLALDRVVQTLADEAVNAGEHGSTLSVRFRPDAHMPSAPTVGQGMTKAHKRGIPLQNGSNYWDAIYSTCLRHGCIAYVQGNSIIISAPQTLTDDTAGNARRVAFGKNLGTFHIKRQLGHKPAPQIVATSYDPAARKVIEARWPEQGDLVRPKKASRPGAAAAPKDNRARSYGHAKKAALLHGTGNTKDEIRRVDAPPGITDLEQLRAYARSYHAQLARAESELYFDTRSLVDLDGKSMITLRQGQAVFLDWDPYLVADLRQLEASARVQRLVALGYGEDLAQVVADNFDGIRQFVGRPFYCHEVDKEWSQDDGLEIAIRALNYVDPAAHGEAQVDARKVLEQTIAPVRQAFDASAELKKLLAQPAVGS